MHKVLILGAGLVARPIVRYFLRLGDVDVTVASLYLEDAEALVDNHSRGTAIAVDVGDTDSVEPLIEGSDLVVSLVPYALHVAVAGFAIRHQVDMITASYVSPEMRALDTEARNAGVTILNETGLDPGLDHMAAMRLIDQVRHAGGRVISLDSCCGGLPSPEAANNPWKYKFSWSPRGALLAGRLGARYLHEGRTVSVPGPELFAHHWPYEVEGVGRFEMYPNRDSMPYIDLYELKNLRSMRRGTIRYPGWCETMKVVADLGLLDIDERSHPPGATYGDLVSAGLPQGAGSVTERLARRLGIATDHEIIARLEWAGLLSDEPLPEGEASLLDLVAARFQRLMVYRPGERDMVLQRHELVASYPDKRPDERFVSLLVAYGEKTGDSATARSVSLPAAIAGDLMLRGKLKMPGVRIPTAPEIVRPVLERLEELGITFKEWSEPVKA